MGKIKQHIDKIAGQSVYIDTNLFIYFLDQNTEFFPISADILEAVEQGKFFAFTGDLTVAEALVKPYQLNNLSLISTFKAFFFADNFLSIASHNADTFDLSSQIRAKYKMKFADALHYATAIKSGCQFFITNDKGIRSTDDMEVILIKDLLK
ncbi:type II toxin-antitoxin system VapC family toxin [Methyloprofundus sp.]|uniref:type II toxin-antitoxin system VapC family toxin n=1 Tax=Methyloprofundus sp. TaxID=2020875 RepID=UPI003D0C5379